MSESGWDQEAEHQMADFLHLLERMQQDYQEAAIEVAEESLKAVAEGSMPNTAHPALARHAQWVRDYDRDLVRVPVVSSLATGYTADESPYPTSTASTTLILTRRKRFAPAPFVGDLRWQRCVYAWSVWTDEYGRAIAGEAEMVWGTT